MGGRRLGVGTGKCGVSGGLGVFLRFLGIVQVSFRYRSGIVQVSFGVSLRSPAKTRKF